MGTIEWMSTLTPTRRTSAGYRQRRRRVVTALFARQGGVASRQQIYALGYPRWEVNAEIRAGRWHRLGRQTIADCAVSLLGQCWRAVFEVGSGAALDGVTALSIAGLRSEEELIHVSVPKSCRYRRVRGVHIHETRRRHPDDVLESGIPRVRPEIAAVRAALWARSNRQAATLMAMAVQQQIVEPGQLWERVETVRRDRRRGLLRAVAADLFNGAQSLGELDFARLCRKYGLPEPDRQTVRKLPNGRAYLDTEWRRYRAVVEIDGVQHFGVDTAIDDLLRQNEVTLGDSRVLRIPVLGLRVHEEEFMGQVRRLLIDGGWHPT